MSETLILPIYNYSDISLPYDWEEQITNTNYDEDSIQKVMSRGELSRDKAIYSLFKSNGKEERAIDYWSYIKYNLKFPEPKKSIESIISIPCIDECPILCANARPVVLTTNAK